MFASGSSGRALRPRAGSFTPWTNATSRFLAERFRKWPEAAITYFGILVSPCKQRIQLPDARVMIVKDRTLGTNDCRGWISRSVFERFQLPKHRLYQFRLAFENTQAKGACKVMADDVAEKLGADIILPESCVKPEYKQTSRILTSSIGESPRSRFVPTGDRLYLVSGRSQEHSNCKAAIPSSSMRPGTRSSSKSHRSPWSKRASCEPHATVGNTMK